MSFRQSRRLALALCALGTAAADWPGWRGPTGTGQADDKKLPLTWNGKTGENVRWKVTLPGVEEKAGQDQKIGRAHV